MDREDRLLDLLIASEEAAAIGAPKTPEELCADCPDLLADFRKLLVRLAPVEAALTGTVDAGPDIDFDAGRYRPVRFHARGGLGEVYAAADAELQRTVALKRIQGLAALDTSARRRFVREAEITGFLEHPGVVPVYGLGRDSAGRPFYAMRFIRGRTLGEEADRFHGRDGPAEPTDPAERNVEFRRLIRGFVSVCQTIAYAHDRGVIHRDIKPDNVMVGPYGETLVLDWGLAKYVGRPEAEVRPADQPAGHSGSADPTGLHISASSNGALRRPDAPVPDRAPSFADTGGPQDATVAGAVLGTLAYMSPEQARGEAVGPASDVYSLGTTLYSLITGGRAYQAGSPHDLLRRVQAGAFTLPREANAEVPRPLDAVCRKAMAFDPAARYSSAAELARDLERWLADEPVTAWREPFAVRARRWLNRNRTLVAAVVLGVAGAAIAAGVASVLLAEKNEQLTATIGDRDRALRERDASNQELRDRNAQLAAAGAAARADFDDGDRRIGRTSAAVDVRLSGGGGAPDPVRTAVYTEARDYYRGFVARNAGRPELAVATAFAEVRQAEAELGLRNDAAIPPLLAAARARFARVTGDPVADYGTARADLLEGRLLVWQLKTKEARPLILRACERLAPLCGSPAPGLARFDGLDSPAARLAAGVMLLRDIDIRTDPRETFLPGPAVAPGEPAFVGWAATAVKALTTEMERDPADRSPELPGLVALLWIALGEEYAVRGRRPESEAYFNLARANLTRIVHLDGSAYELELVLAYLKLYPALALKDDGKAAEAERALAAARDQMRELARRQWGPDEGGIQNRAWLFTANMSKTLGDWAVRTNPQRATEHYRAAVDAFDKVAVAPGRYELSLRTALLKGYGDIGVTAVGSDLSIPLARTALGRCRDQFAALAPMLGDADWFRRERLYVDSMLGGVLMIAKEDPFPLLNGAVTGLAEYVKQRPDDALGHLQYGIALMVRGTAGVLSDRWDAGRADLLQAQAILRKPRTRPEAAREAYRQASLMLAHAGVLRGGELLDARPPDPKNAREWAEVGLAALKQLEETGPLTAAEKELRGALEALKKRTPEPPK